MFNVEKNTDAFFDGASRGSGAALGTALVIGTLALVSAGVNKLMNRNQEDETEAPAKPKRGRPAGKASTAKKAPAKTTRKRATATKK